MNDLFYLNYELYILVYEICVLGGISKAGIVQKNSHVNTHTLTNTHTHTHTYTHTHKHTHTHRNTHTWYCLPKCTSWSFIPGIICQSKSLEISSQRLSFHLIFACSLKLTINLRHNFKNMFFKSLGTPDGCWWAKYSAFVTQAKATLFD